MSKIYCVDAKTGDKVLRDMTEAEEKILADSITAGEASRKAWDEAQTKKAADQLAGKIKLKELGLTDDQIAALLD